MRRVVSIGICLLLMLSLAGCNEAEKAAAEAARKAAEEQSANEKAAQEQAVREKERQAAEARLREELKPDYERLLGHWDHVGGKGPDGKPLPSLHLEITVNQVARFRMISGPAHSTAECSFRLTGEEGQHFLVQDDSSSELKLTRLAYRIDGDLLILKGGANDVLLKQVDLSGEWRRTDWTKKSEAEIADLLKSLSAQIEYDEESPMKPIVKVSFAFQAPIHNVHLRPLVGLKRLQELDLSSTTNVTEDGFKFLAVLKQLKQLNLTTIPASDEAVRELGRELPNCRITR